MCSLYFLGVIAAFFGFGFLGISTVETSSEFSPSLQTEFSNSTSVSASGNLEIMTLFAGESVINFPRQSPSLEREAMEAQLFGTLIEQNNCLYVEPDTGDAAYLIIWAADYSLTFDNGVVVVLDAFGEEGVRAGQSVYLSGGEIPVGSQTDYERESGLLPIENCDGPYWVMGDIAQPATD